MVALHSTLGPSELHVSGPVTQVRGATVVNGALATAYENGDTVDGVVLATGNRILLKNQTSGAENGIYTVNASGAPTRATDFDAAGDMQRGFPIYVQEGTVNANTAWLHTTSATITVGTTALTFAQLGGPDAAHLSDAVDAHAASAITNTPAGAIAATTAQAAINELDTEKAPLAGPTFTGIVTLPKLVRSTQAPAYAASITPDVAVGENILVGTLTGAITVNAPTNPTAGQVITFVFTQDATGGRVVTWNAVFKVNWTPDTALNKVNTITFLYNGTSWLQVAGVTGL